MKTKKTLQQKIREEHPEFAEAVQSLSVGELDQRLAELAKQNEQVAEAKDADEDLAEARERASQMAAPYSESIKLIRLKSKYIISLIKERS
jgi:hypothetical protein